jgi:hypothetical protein
MTVCLALFVLPRYRMVVEPLMIPFAAEALLWAYRKIAGMEDGRSRLQTSLSSKSSAMADPALTAVAVPSDKD